MMRCCCKSLGTSYRLWEAIRESLAEAHGALVEEWKHYGAKSGWTMKTLLKKRNLFFFIPHEKSFRIGFVFGDKAVAAMAQSDLPRAVIDEVTNAKRYVEGRGLRIDVRNRADVQTVMKLVSIKIEN